MYQFSENSHARIWVQNGILFFIYKENTSIDLKVARLLVKARLELQGEKEYPVLCDIRGLFDVTKEARDYMAFEGTVNVSALALVIDNPVNKVISEVFMKANNPNAPVEVFLLEEEAVNYLKKFVK